jgi:hypothetical protein
MSAKIKVLLIALTLAGGLTACTNEEIGTGVGGAAGAGLGYAVSDSAAGAAIGGAGGALLGNQIGKKW